MDIPPGFSLDPIRSGAINHPSRAACCDTTTLEFWTYVDLDGDVSTAAAHLAGEGVRAGDRVAVLAPNSVYLVILQHALMRLGAIFVPLNWRLSLPELARLLADCLPAILYTHSSHGGGGTGTPSSGLTTETAPPPGGCRHLDWTQTFVDPIRGARKSPPEPITPRAVSADAMATILYTSGTSGKPKGVVLTRRNMAATGLNFSALGAVEETSMLLCDAPMFHVIGLVVAVWAPLARGAAFVVSPRFDPAATNDRLASGVTHYFCVPQMADALSRAPNFRPEAWPRLRALFTGGAPNPPARINEWLGRGVLMVDGYGTTETGTTLGMPLSPAAVAAKAGSVGRQPPLVSVGILDELGNPAGVGEAGEVAVAGPSVSPGYWGGVSADGQAKLLSLDGSGATAAPVSGAGGGTGEYAWYRTGDVGRRDEDGFVYIMDRRKDVFISGGENVYAAEVEAALAAHSKVAEVAVIGVPDARWGEVGRAYIVLTQQEEERAGGDTSQRPGETATSADLVEHCRGLIGGYKIPKQFRFVHGLPRTGSGKVMKHVLKAEAASETDGSQ
ncbi:hypothetical protein RB595_000257 [Gaeumannomyces hyphopodioides]